MDEDVTHRYHRLTSYSADRSWLVPAADPDIRQDFIPIYGHPVPVARKHYSPELSRERLPAGPHDIGVAGREALMGAGPRRGEPAALGVDELSWLLHWSAGMVRQRVTEGGRTISYRAAGSAGNRHPIEVYVHASDVSGLPDGMWHYAAEGHELVRVGDASGKCALIILTGIPWRTAWKYAERGYRHLWWDAGAIVANLEMLASAAGRVVRVRLNFPDAIVAEAVGADPRSEFPLVIVELDGREARLEPIAPAAAGDLGPQGPDFPLIRAVHEAGCRLDGAKGWSAATSAAASGPARTMAAATAVPPAGSAESEGWPAVSAEDLIRRRAATRRFGTAPVARAELMWQLSVATRPMRWDGPDVPATLLAFAHEVTDLAPGRYRHRSAGHLDAVVLGDFRSDAMTCCLGQAAAGECACLIVIAADLDSQIRSQGQRGYRGLQLYAGIAAGRVQLAAVAANLGSVPLTMCDETAARFIPGAIAPLLAVAVGPREHPPPPSGTPRSPAVLAGDRR